jgi:hypothetical protein
MISLAVIMGFFAESLREYFGDREKEAGIFIRIQVYRVEPANENYKEDYS